MSGLAAVSVLRGEDAGLVTGMTWVPEQALRVAVRGAGASDAAHALAAVARGLELDIAFVDAGEEWSADAAGLLGEAGVASAWAVSGVLGRASEERGWAGVLSDSATRPGELAFLFDEVLHGALEDVRRGAAAGAPVAVVADDLGSASGWLVSPDFAHEALVPCYHALAAEAKRHGMAVVFHSDGDVRALYPALARAGFDAAHIGSTGHASFEAVFAAARSAGLVALGGIAGATVLAGARSAGEAAGEVALGGGLIVCDDGGIVVAEELAAFSSALAAARRTYDLHEDTNL